MVRRYVTSLFPGTQVVSGGARGVDTAAEAAARARRDLPEPKVFPADWDRLGKGAGAIRNEQIVDYAQTIVAFWDGVSPGTKNTIDLAAMRGKPFQVIRPPRVVNYRHEAGVYIGRPSKWGNPFTHMEGTDAPFRVATREEAVHRFAEWLPLQPFLIAALPELRGLDLACSCKWRGDELCHGDVLIKFANVDADIWHWVSCGRFTAGLRTTFDGIIVEAAPIVQTFMGQHFLNLYNWMMNKVGPTKYAALVDAHA